MMARIGGKLGQIRRSKRHVLPFTDHAGKEALMVFVGWETSPLPPLYSFSLYFTHEDVNPGNVHPVELLNALVKNTPLDCYPCPFRLELYFLPMPGATVEECDAACIAHYLEEKRIRGDYMRQIEDIETSVSPSGSLPGFVPSYIDNKYCEWHRGLLYSYQAADWRTDKQLVRRVVFDPLPEEELGSLAEEVKEEFHGVLPQMFVSLLAIRQSDTEDLGALVGSHMFLTAHGDTENVTNEPRHIARERGWSTW